MSDVDVAAIRAALEVASQGLWATNKTAYGHTLEGMGRLAVGHVRNAGDADLIVLLRNNAEALLDELELMRSRLAEAETVVQGVLKTVGEELTVQQAYERMEVAEADYHDALDRQADENGLA